MIFVRHTDHDMECAQMQTEAVIDSELHRVVEFMQANLPTTKLIAVAESLPQVARLLWSEFPQESFRPFSLRPTKTAYLNQSQSASTE